MSLLKSRVGISAAGSRWGMSMMGLALVGALSPSRAHGDSSLTADYDTYQRFLTTLNQPTLIEGAGSLGAMGYTVGLGAQQLDVAGDSRLIRHNAYLEDGALTGRSLSMPKIFLAKGTPWPVDLGLSHGVLANGRISQTTGHIQWTIYQELAMPAIAVRASYAKLNGFRETVMTTKAAEAVASYSFLRYFTVYGRYGWQWHEASWQAAESAQTVYYLGEGTNGDSVSRSWRDATQGWGLEVTAWPPFVTVAAEVVSADQGSRQIFGKVAVGI